MRQRVYTAYDRRYNRAWMQRRRGRVMLRHPQVNSTHCRGCWRRYHRNAMRARRAGARA